MSLRMNGLHKSAVLLSSLGPEQARLILRRLPRELAEQIGGELDALPSFPHEQRIEVLAEFCAAASGFHSSGLEASGLHLLPSPQSSPRDQIDQRDASAAAPFAGLHQADPDNLIECLHGEHPQAIALILAHLPATRCAQVLSALPPEQRFQVVKRLVHLEQASAEVIQQVEHSLEGRVGCIVDRISDLEAGETMADVLDRAASGELDHCA